MAKRFFLLILFIFFLTLTPIHAENHKDGNTLEISNVVNDIREVYHVYPTVTLVKVTNITVEDGKAVIKGIVGNKTVTIKAVSEKSPPVPRQYNIYRDVLTEGHTYIFSLLPPKETVFWLENEIAGGWERIRINRIDNPVYIATNVFGEYVYPIGRYAFDYDANKLYPADERQTHIIQPYKP